MVTKTRRIMVDSARTRRLPSFRLALLSHHFKGVAETCQQIRY
jgi:hypothetical protein